MAEIKIEGMRCQHCVASVTRTLAGIGSLADIKVDLDTGLVSFNGEADRAVIKAAISAIGFEVVD